MSSQSANSASPAPGNDNDPVSAMQYTLNSKVMVAAVVVLFVVVFFIITLHFYAKWFWRRSASLRRRRAASWRRRHRLEFTGEEPSNNIGHSRGAGLDVAVINSLPIFVYQLPKDAEQEAAAAVMLLECAVCLCEFEEGEKGRLLPDCKHSFHTECIDMWFHSHTTCPLCRTVVSVELESPSSGTTDTSSMQGDNMGSTSPMPLLRNASDSHHHSRPASDAVLITGDGMLYPNNILFWGDHNHVSSQLSSPGISTTAAGGGGSSSTRSLPQISIDIPRRLESLSTAASRCLSLSRCPSMEDQAGCSAAHDQYNPQKSPSIRMSIKRLLSREWSRGRPRASPSSTDMNDGREQDEESIALTHSTQTV